jgi:hypothetical protein
MRGKGELSSSSWAALSQSVKADRYRRHRVRFSAWVKTDQATEGAWLWMRGDGPRREAVAFDAMHARLIKGTTTWAQHSIVLNLPEETEILLIGFGLNGRGTAWFGDVVLEIVGENVQTTDVQLPLEPVNLNFEDAT